MKTERIIAHLDMDAFFAAIEAKTSPHWQDQPLIVCGGGRGVVATASYTARALGVKSGQPVTEAKRLAPQGIFVEADHQKYLWFSRRIFGLLKEFLPVVEVVSIDEAFIDLTGMIQNEEQLRALILKIKAQIRAATGLTCSIGVANNKLLAKIASDYQKPDGLIILDSNAIQWLQGLEIEKLPGLGGKTAAFLSEMSVSKVGELVKLGERQLVSWFGANGAHLYQMALGKDNSPVLAEAAPLKSFSQEITLNDDSNNQEELEAVLWWLSELVGRRLRAAEMAGKTVTLKLRYADFKTITRSQTRMNYLSLDSEIATEVRELLQKVWHGEAVRLLGIKISNLTSLELSMQQLTLWDQAEEEYQLTKTIDALKTKYGEEILMRGSAFAWRKKK